MKRREGEKFETYRAALSFWAMSIKNYLKGHILKGTASWYKPKPKRAIRWRKTKRRYDWKKAKSRRIMQKMSRRKNRRMK